MSAARSTSHDESEPTTLEPTETRRPRRGTATDLAQIAVFAALIAALGLPGALYLGGDRRAHHLPDARRDARGGDPRRPQGLPVGAPVPRARRRRPAAPLGRPRRPRRVRRPVGRVPRGLAARRRRHRLVHRPAPAPLPRAARARRDGARRHRRRLPGGRARVRRHHRDAARRGVPRLARLPPRRPRQGRRHRARREGRAPRVARADRPAAVAVAAWRGGVHPAHERLAARLVATTSPSRSAATSCGTASSREPSPRHGSRPAMGSSDAPRAPIPSPSSPPCSPPSTAGGRCSSAPTSRRQTDSRGSCRAAPSSPCSTSGSSAPGGSAARGRPDERLVARVGGSARRAHGPRRRRPHRGDRPAARVDAPLRGAARAVARRVGRRRPRRRDRRARDADPARTAARRPSRAARRRSSPAPRRATRCGGGLRPAASASPSTTGRPSCRSSPRGRDGRLDPFPGVEVQLRPAASGDELWARSPYLALGVVGGGMLRRDADGLRHRRRPGRTDARRRTAHPRARRRRHHDRRAPPCSPSTSSRGSCRCPASRRAAVLGEPHELLGAARRSRSSSSPTASSSSAS